MWQLVSRGASWVIYFLGAMAPFAPSIGGANPQAIDFVVIGDSQLWGHTFGFQNYLSQVQNLCPQLSGISSAPSYVTLSVSGSGFHHWVQPSAGPWSHQHGDPCNLSETIQLYGNAMLPETLSISLPLGDEHVYWPGFCLPQRSAMQGLAEVRPKFLIATFLGAHQGEHGSNYEILRKSYAQFVEQLSSDTACLVMTNPPLFERSFFNPSVIEPWREQFISDGKSQDEFGAWLSKETKIYSEKQKHRRQAAEMIHQLVEEDGRCSLVKGFDLEGLAPLMSDPSKFYGVDLQSIYYDAYHLTEEGSYKFFELKSDEICGGLQEAQALRDKVFQ